MQNPSGPIAVYGASGHTGRFVVQELVRRGLPAVAIARDLSRVAPGVPARQASLDDPASLDRALAGCSVVIHCAGPFLDTAAPVIEAALRTGVAYLDVTAEQGSAQSTFERHDTAARDAGLALIPAAGFYGGLADLLATSLVGDGPARAISVGVALDHWWPTAGTRETGVRNRLPRVVVEDGVLVPMQQPPRHRTWHFGGRFGEQPMVELGFSEVITLSRHLHTLSLHSWLNTGPLDELRDASTPPPSAIDTHGRSAQRFVMEVVVDTGRGERRARAEGQDIYAVSAPLLVEAAQRLRDPGFDGRGALSLAQAFPARDFLAALAPQHLCVEFEDEPVTP